MTEAEWWTTTDLRALLDFLAPASPRKLRLFACECWRRDHPGRAEEAAVIEVYRRYLDGDATPAEWFEAYSGAGGTRLGDGVQHLIAPDAIAAARRTAGLSRALFRLGVWHHWPAERPEQAALLRDIFGNPFRPVSFDPAWRTDTVVPLAKGMYGSRDFSVMPILADALQDAGCDNDDILAHCRAEGVPHVRGCWAVDLVLGKA